MICKVDYSLLHNARDLAEHTTGSAVAEEPRDDVVNRSCICYMLYNLPRLSNAVCWR